MPIRYLFMQNIKILIFVLFYLNKCKNLIFVYGYFHKSYIKMLTNEKIRVNYKPIIVDNS